MSGNPHQKYRPYLSLFQMKRILSYVLKECIDNEDEEIISTLKLQIFKAENSLSVPASKPLISRLGIETTGDEFPEPKMPIPSISPPLRETLTETEEDEIMKQLMNPMNSPKIGES